VEIMQVTATVKCYHCGHVSGTMRGQYGQRLYGADFKPRDGYEGLVPGPGEPVRCERCTGPIYLEDVTPVVPMTTIRRIRRMRSELAKLDRHQRELAGAA
jgi:hypothetical protein